MKGRTHAQAPAVARVQRKATARRTGARMQGHELQADRAAHGFVRGETGLVRHLAPAPAAGFALPGSQAEPLPTMLRLELEQAFAADFAAVRLHRDAGAQRAAAALGAQAFVSGADVYFAAGRLDFTSPTGRALIAHELAHTLQQAGRRSADGRLRVTAVGAADGWVQCQPDPADTPALQQQRYDQVVAAHRGGLAGADASLEQAEQALRTAFEGRIVPDGRPQSAQALAAEVTNNLHDGKSLAARALMCDVLKATGYFEAALHLIDTDTEFNFKTLFERQVFVDFLLTQPNAQDWAARALYVRPELRRFWPSVLLADLTAFVFQPHRGAQPNAALAQALQERREGWRAHALSPDGDRVRMAWRLLAGMDQDRVRECTETQQEVDTQYPALSLVARRLEVTRRLRARFDLTVNDAAAAPYSRDIAGQMARRAGQAVAVFEPVLQALEQGFVRLSAGTDATLFDGTGQPLLGRALVHPLGAELQALMMDRLARAVPRQVPGEAAPVFPDSQTYAQSLIDYRAALSTAQTDVRRRRVEAFDLRLDQALHGAVRTAAPDMQPVRELALLVAVIDALKSVLQAYSPAQDDLTPNFDDERRVHAVRLARAHAQIGVMLGWPTLVSAAQPYLQTPQASVHLATEWVPDGDAHPSRMEGDFSGNLNRRVLYDVPLSIRHIARWFRLEHRRRERALLLGLLEQQDQPTVDTEIPWNERMSQVTHSRQELLESLLTSERALAAQREGRQRPSLALKDPQRFVVHDFDLTAPAGFNGQWSAVIEAHPKTQLLLQGRPDGGAYIFPEQVGRELFGWLTPDLRPLLDFLVASPVFAAQLTAGAADDPLAWFNALAQGDALDAAVNRAIDAELDPLNAEVPLLWRALTTYRRRVLVLQSVAKLDQVVASAPRAVDPSYLWPEQVARAVVEFEPTIRPRVDGGNDTDIQMALLTMGIAVPLSELFTRQHTRERAANDLYQYVLLALRVLRDPLRRDEVRAVTHPDEALHNLYDDAGLTMGLILMLQSAQQAMEGNARRVRDSRGFEVVQGKTALLPMGRATPVHAGQRNAWVRNAPVLPNGEIDESRGDIYYIQEIFEQFSYFPPYGSPTPAAMRPGAGGVYIPPRLVMNGEELDLASPEAINSARAHVLFLLVINDVPTPVTAGDIALLDEINAMLLGRSVQISMNRLAAITEGWMQAMIAGVQFVFPATAYAETVLNVATFVAGDEFAEIARQLKDDPHELLGRVLELVQGNYLTADAIWRFLLLGGQHPLFRTAGMVHARTARRLRATGRLARVLRGLRSIGRRIHRAIERLREYSRPPLRAVEGNLMQRPKLVWVLHKALMLAELVADLLPSDLKDFDVPDLAQIPLDLSENLQRLVEGLSRLELPEQIFDNAIAVSMLVEFVLARMGWRGRAIGFVLANTPVFVQKDDNTLEQRSLLDDIGGLIAQGLVNHSAIDPNNLWRDLFPQIQGRFHTARDDLVDGIIANVNTLFTRLNPMLPADRQFAAVQRPALTDLEIVHTDIDDGADLYREPALPAAAHTPPLARTGGQALGGGAQRFYESRLGHDLSHVRLHGGLEGHRATAPLGAEALTSGSHVYLSPRLATGGLRQRHILGHELAHVVQQTRPGPPGQGMAPQRGRPGLGVRAHRPSEWAADRVAAAISASRQVAPGDLAAGPRRLGVQPAVSAEVLDRIVQQITKVSGPADFEMRPVAGAARVPGVATANAIWTSARGAIAAATGAEHFAAFMLNPDTVKALVIGQILNEADSRIKPHIAGIAQLAQRPLAGPRPDVGPTTELHPGRFVTLLESFIFASRGIAVQLTLGAGNTVTRVRFTNVHLAWVGGSHGLWTIAFERAYPKATARERETTQREVRQLLTVLGPQPFIWAASEFSLSASFMRRLEEAREARSRGADSVPPKADYLQTDSTRGDNLSIATHGNLTRRGIGAFSRESHHTTQYLLAEYFGNSPAGRQQAFPRSLRNVLSPGVAFDADGSVSAISSGSSTLQVSQLDPDSGRGNNMPAILLAATTHQRGDLHVTPSTDWRVGADGSLEAHGSRSQGNAIKTRFNNALDAVGLAMRDDTTATRSRIGAAVRADRSRVEREIYSAAVATYHWMHDRMIGRLKEGLRGEERAYYRAIAARHAENLVAPDSSDLKPAYDLTEADMDRVWDRARAHNDRVMSAAGWPAP